LGKFIGPGEYPGGHTISGIEKLTIVVLDTKHPPVFKGGKTGFQFSRFMDLTLRHIRITGQSLNGINLDDVGNLSDPATGSALEHIEVNRLIASSNQKAFKKHLSNHYCHLQETTR
jgi:hypothetical protein